MSLVPVPAEEQGATTCAGCGAELVADQRYCLSCGQPASPVRLAFLDVLDRPATPATAPGWGAPGGPVDVVPLGYAALPPEPGASGWLRRNQGLLSLLSVLVLCLIAGLLIGHWASQGKGSSGPQIVKIEGLGAIAPSAANSGAATTGQGASSTSAAKSSTAKEEAEESKEAAKETAAEKAPPPPPKQVTKAQEKKISSSTGKKHVEEINALGAAPIETS